MQAKEAAHRAASQLVPAAGPLLHPFDEPARLNLKEITEGIQRLGVQPAEPAADPREPVGDGVTAIGALTEGVGGDVPLFHEQVDPKSYHDASFRGDLADSGCEPRDIQHGTIPLIPHNSDNAGFPIGLAPVTAPGVRMGPTKIPPNDGWSRPDASANVRSTPPVT